MNTCILFQMDAGYRQHLIATHRFYVEEGQSRLLSQFDDISADADAFAERWANERSHRFDPEGDDPNGIDERAWEESITHYGMLEDLHADVRLAIIAGMYHAWDKELRDWITRQIGHWHSGPNARAEIWKAAFPRLMEFLEGIGWTVSSLPCHRKLDRCRLVVNVYKHGEGTALETLKKDHSDLLRGGLLDVMPDSRIAKRIVGYRHLRVTDDHLGEFSDAIVDFWAALPERILGDDIKRFPSWFDKAVSQDGKKRTKSKTYTPGGDAKVIAEIARTHFGGYLQMFKHHGWPERGSDMMRKVQTQVKNTYGSVRAFEEKYEGVPHDKAEIKPSEK